MKKIKIIIVDDHQMFRDGLKAILSDEPTIELMAELGSAKELYTVLETNTPDLIITDISMPGVTGIELAEVVKSKYDNVKILFLSMHSNEEYITKAIQAGADGYLPKETNITELLKAINTIHQGDNYFNKKISNKILQSIIDHKKTTEQTSNTDKLTSREKEIIELVVAGLTNKEIADKLFISIRTVDSHKNHIMQKKHLKSTVDLVKFAIKNNLASLD